MLSIHSIFSLLVTLYVLYRPHYALTQFEPKILKRLLRKAPHTHGLILVSLLLMIIALARPQGALKDEIAMSDAKEIIIALDMSGSMSGAYDYQPNRFERAKSKIKTLLSLRTQDRIGVIGFTSNAITLSPMSHDKMILTYMFDSVETKYITTKSTKIQPVIELASKMSDAKQKILVLFSDGGEEKKWSESITLAQQEGISVYMIAMATTHGAQLMGSRGELIDKSGKIVVSTNNQTIKALCRETGGEWIQSTQNGSDIETLSSMIDERHKSGLHKSQLRQYEEYFYYFIVASLIIMIIATLNIPLKRAQMSSLIITLLILPQMAHSSIWDWWSIRQAQQSLDAKEYRQALQTYESLPIQKREVQAKLLYNMGTIYAILGEYEQALQRYRSSLILAYDEDTMHNYMVVYEALKDKELRTKEQSDTQQRQASQEEGESKVAKANDQALSHSRPLGFETYELINKGGANETHPW